MSSLTETCATLARLLPEAAELITEPDTDGTTGTGQPSSRPPWNTAAANATMDVHAAVRHIEHAMRLEARLPARRRGGSDANTIAAITAIGTLASADISDTAITAAARDLERLIRPIQELAAVDQAEPWRRIPATCPYCGFGMLRVAPRAGTVTCLRYGACSDSDGKHPIGHVYVSQLTGDPRVHWNDGLVAP